MSKKGLLGVHIAVILLSGCTATFTENRGDDEGIQLEVTKGVYIVSPEDGRYGDKIFANSGQMTASAVEVAFSNYATRVNISDKCAISSTILKRRGWTSATS